MGMRVALLLGALSASAMLTGCAVSGSTGTTCSTTLVMNITPTSATADHTLPAPGNQVRFQTVVAPTAPDGCALPAFLLAATPTWTNPDPKDISIDSSSNPGTNGLATCMGATSGPITLTATFGVGDTTLTQTTTLTCK